MRSKDRDPAFENMIAYAAFYRRNSLNLSFHWICRLKENLSAGHIEFGIFWVYYRYLEIRTYQFRSSAILYKYKLSIEFSYKNRIPDDSLSAFGFFVAEVADSNRMVRPASPEDIRSIVESRKCVRTTYHDLKAACFMTGKRQRLSLQRWTHLAKSCKIEILAISRSEITQLDPYHNENKRWSTRGYTLFHLNDLYEWH